MNHKYKVWCETDNQWEYAEGVPTETCPTNGAHTVKVGSIAITGDGDYADIQLTYSCQSCDGEFPDKAGISAHLIAEPNHIVMEVFKNTSSDGKSEGIVIKRPDGAKRKLKVSDTDVLTVEV